MQQIKAKGDASPGWESFAFIGDPALCARCVQGMAPRKEISFLCLHPALWGPGARAAPWHSCRGSWQRNRELFIFRKLKGDRVPQRDGPRVRRMANRQKHPAAGARGTSVPTVPTVPQRGGAPGAPGAQLRCAQVTPSHMICGVGAATTGTICGRGT